MKYKWLFVTLVVTSLLFVILIIREPIGYDPLFLCILFFCVFFLPYIGLTRSHTRMFDKFPRKIKAILSGVNSLIGHVVFFYIGWIAHDYWIFHDKKEMDFLLLIVLVPFSIGIVREGYKAFLNR